jgi:FHA domain-containing protein
VITLTVVTYNNAPADGALSAGFDELGGTIGRADTNHLVLPDPERTISRVAAQVVFRNGAFAIVDRGSNPVVVNGQPLGSGREAPLKTGDRVRIGGYELAVSVTTASRGNASSSDPFADLLGPSSTAASPSSPLYDPLAATGFGAVRAPGAAPPTGTAPTPSAGTPAGPAAGGIPMDWDPFAPEPATPARAPSGQPDAGRLGLDIGAAPPTPLVSNLSVPTAEPSSLDQLFGLGPSSSDPLANTLLDAPAALPNMAADADPLRSLGSAPKAQPQAMPDLSSDLNRPFIPPTTIKPAAPRGAVMSWDSEGAVSHTVIRPSRPAPSAQPVTAPPPAPQAWPQATVPTAGPTAPSAGTTASAAGPASDAGAESAAATARASTFSAPHEHPGGVPTSSQGGDAGALLQAFLRGLQSPNVQLGSLTPQVMELIGQLLREAADGTVDLLVARAAFKRELRAQATTIVARDNNPLKFSPSGEVALQHLLSPAARGFMPAAPAMRDAYNDLRAHQIGFVAGLQAALDGVLGRFDPAELEKRLTERSMLHNLVPGSRKARLWEVFIEHYGRIRTEASDDFHTLFGAAFLKAYEEQIDRLERGSPT